MEILRSTNIVFNSQADESGGGGGKSIPYKKSRSPVENRHSRASKLTQAPLPSVTPMKGLSQDSPFTKGSIIPSSTSDYESMKPDDSSPYKFIMGPSNTPMSLRKRTSPADSGIEMTPISTSPYKINPKLRTMYNSSRRDGDESTDFSINPDPVPYQASNFLSSTTMKKVPMSRRHLDTFGADLVQSLGKRGVFLHTDRYQWDLASALDGLSQRERLQAELEYMEKLRGIKRRREVLPHRARLDLLMGGKKVEFCERFDIQREIQKLRSLILPQHAKDLYHGRGFTLPEHHNSLKPRKALPLDIDFEDDLASPFSPDKYSINPETGRVQPKWQKSFAGSPSTLPKISSKGYLLGHGSPVLLSKEKRTVESIKARLRIPTKNFRAQKGEPIPVKTPNPFTYEMEDTWTPYVTRQTTMVSPIQRLGSKSPPLLPFSPRRQYRRDRPMESPDLTLYPISHGVVSPRYGAPQQVHMVRSKTNVVTRDAKHGGGRSLTAYPNKKETQHRPAATAPTIGPSPRVQGKVAPVKIPVSARDPEETDTNPEPNSAVTASGGPLSGKKPEIEEILQQPDTGQEDESRVQASGMSTARSVAPTPNPLKGIELPVTAEEQTRLKQTFNKLDTDKDGHIKFSQLQTQLPPQFSQSQEKYIKQVYDITSSSTFFGVDEFMTMSYLTNVVTNLRGEALEAYNKLDFTGLHETIIKYLELYQSVDRGHRGKITLDSLQNILCTALPIDLKANVQQWNRLVDNLSLNDPGLLSKIEFIAHVPYFLCIRDKK